MMKNQLWPGLLCVGAVAGISYLIGLHGSLANAGISSLVVAIVLGMVVGNTVPHPASWHAGIQFSAKRLLRLAIILYGFRVSFQQITAVGYEAFIIDVIVVSSTILLGYVVGSRLFKLDKELSLLIGCGAGICGAAAVLAAEDILKSEPFKASIAVGTVVLFGTLSMFIYPALQHSGMLRLSPTQFGIFAGASVHEVAQVLVTGNSIAMNTGRIAVIVKMIRVLLLVPVLFVLAAIRKRSHTRQHAIVVPWFAIGFLLIIIFNSCVPIPQHIQTSIQQLDTVLLTMAMAAIGIETKLSKIKHVGLRPLYLAALLSVWLFGSVWAMVQHF